MKLHLRQDGAGPPVVLLHGFSGGIDAWTPVAERLQGSFRVIRVDLPGHGASPAPAPSGDERRDGLEPTVRAILERLEEVGVRRAAWVGYSMGGRIALHAAVHHPRAIERLVLESASPGLADAAERCQRVRADEALADSIVREGLERFVERWLGQPLFASQGRLPEAVREAERVRRLRADPVKLATALRHLGVGRQQPLWERLPEVRIPTLLLVGELDVKFVATARRMRDALGDARLRVVEGAGHATHLERPEVFVAQVQAFLGGTGTSTQEDQA